MNFRIVTLGGVLFLALAAQPLVRAADQVDIVTNPLRGSDREPTLENGFYPFAAIPENAAGPRSPPDLWRNPGSLRTAEAQLRPSTHAPMNAAPMNAVPMPADAADHVPPPPAAAQPPRTLIQRIRDRRLAQLEKQAERLRELSQRDGLQAGETSPSGDLNGPENPDLQIDLGMPTESTDSTEHVLPLIGPSAMPPEMQPGWAPHRPGPPDAASPLDANPATSPPIEIQIDLPEDGMPPARPPTQSRLRNWWADPLR